MGFSVHAKDDRSDDMKKRLRESLRSQFRPEFLNRVDDIIVFNALSKDHLSRIVDLQLDAVAKLLKERKVNLEVTAAARDAIIAEGYDPQYGARPMRRAIQRLIQDPLALQLLNGEYLEGDTVLVDSGLIRLKVLEKLDAHIRCRVLTPGQLSSRRHINLPGVKVNLPPLTEKDLAASVNLATLPGP